MNIVNPDSNGLSYNKYIEFDVSNKGAVLNNATSVVNTQIGGVITLNDNLINSADTILNEIKSTNTSNLNGFIEVGGKKADLIFINPNGISINGGGFINSNAVTLSTGTAEFNSNKALTGYTVDQGLINITGDEFNTSNIAKVNLYSKAITINAKMTADGLYAVTGSNHIATDGTVTKGTATSTGLAIDSTALGGIYANQITLISSDKGVGVNLVGEASAQDTLNIDAQGNITLGKTSAKNSIDLKSNSNVVLKDTTTSASITVNAKDSITTQQNAASDVHIIAENTLNFTADTISNGVDLNIGYNPSDMSDTNTSAQASFTARTFNNAKQILSTGVLDLYSTLIDNIIDTTSVFTNNGLIKANDINGTLHTLNNGTTGTHDASLYATNNLTLSANTINNLSKNNTAKSVLFSGAHMQIHTENALTNKGTIYSGGNMTVAGKNGTKTGTLLNDPRDAIDSTTESKGDMVIKVDTLNNLGKADTVKKESTTTSTSRKDSREHVDEDLITKTVTTSDISNNDGNAAKILSGKTLNIDVETGLNQYSLMHSTGDMQLNAQSMTNKSLRLQSSYAVTEDYVYTYSEEWCNDFGGDCTTHYWHSIHQREPVQPKTYKTSRSYGIRTNGNLTGNVVTLQNGEDSQTASSTGASYYASNSTNTTDTPEVIDPTPTVPTGKFGIYIASKNPEYLVETNPIYTSMSKFVGSDFFLEKMGLLTSNSPMRYGDGNAELSIIRDQIINLTGSKTLVTEKGTIQSGDETFDLASEQGQMTVLMQQAIDIKDELQLELGEPLTESQQKSLKKDIIWMEYKTINGKKSPIPKSILSKRRS